MKRILLPFIIIAALAGLTVTALSHSHKLHKKPAEAAYTCFGNEPFWNLKISPKSIMFVKLDSAKTALKPTKPIPALGMKPDFVKVYKTYTLRKKYPATIVMTHNEKGCSDGMSDKDHQYNVVVVFPTNVLFGCCNQQS